MAPKPLAVSENTLTTELTRSIRLAIPFLGDAEIEAATEVLRSGYLVQGPRVAEFERCIAERVGTAEAVAVSSGTAALHLALLTLDIGLGDAVATTTYSWPATSNVIALAGATPLFVDIDPATFNMCPLDLARVCQTHPGAPQLKAVLPIHAFGLSADMTAIHDVATQYKIPVIEDAACALGAMWSGIQTGSIGEMGCFSFHPRKAITTGEGGIITTNDSAIVSRLRTLRNHGLDSSASSPSFILPGYNYRMGELNAAIGIAQCQRLDQLIDMRRERAHVYDTLLAESEIISPHVPDVAYSVYQSYVVRIPASDQNQHQEVIAALRGEGVEVTIGTYHIPLTEFYRGKFEFHVGDFPNTDLVAHQAVTLPLHHELTDDDQAYVVERLKHHVQTRCR